MRRSSLEQWFLYAKKGDDARLDNLMKGKSTWNIDVRDDKARTALYLASKSGNLTCVENLLKNGADPNRRSQFGAPAHAAIQAGNVEILRTLLSYGAHLNTKNNKRLTVLECAIEEFGDQNIKYFLEHVDTNKKFEWILKRRKSSLNVKVLIEAPLPEITPKEITHYYDTDPHAEGPYNLYTKGRVHMEDVTLKKYKNTVNKELIAKLFANEVMILSDLRHPNILMLMSACYGPSTADCCMVLEPVGCNDMFLHKMIHTDKEQFEEDTVLRIARDIACGLLFIHQKGFIHCYLGSHSVVITDKHKAKICNFEYARAVTSGYSCEEPICHLEPLYEWMAPEQLQGKAADQLCDVFSLGITVWEMITGKKPFHSIRNFKSLMAKEDPRIRCIPAKWVGCLKQLIKDCTLPAKNRPTSMQVYEWLDGFTNNRLVSYRPAYMAIEELPLLFPKTKPKLEKGNK